MALTWIHYFLVKIYLKVNSVLFLTKVPLCKSEDEHVSVLATWHACMPVDKVTTSRVLL